MVRGAGTVRSKLVRTEVGSIPYPWCACNWLMFYSTRESVFEDVFGNTLAAVRQRIMSENSDPDNTTVLLKYRKPFELSGMLSFMKPRAIKGVEVVSHDRYARTFRTDRTSGFFLVKDNPEQSAVELKICCNDRRCSREIHDKVRRMFDLDTDFRCINRKFAQDRILSKGMKNGQVPRLPVAFDPFECVVRAILGQQVTVKAATTMAARIVKQANLKVGMDSPPGLDYFFPDPSDLLALELDGLGITRMRQATLRNTVHSIIDKRVQLTSHQPFDRFHKDFSAIKGIGDWTVNYVSMRGLGMIDSFPATDLGIIKALTRNGKVPSKKQVIDMAEHWRPYRSYATLCLWNSGDK
jgi:AraC family transcriptional regulator of adaptative response / DNA-3-methyladenine glycosylase II